MKRTFSILLVLSLISAVLLSFTGCKKQQKKVVIPESERVGIDSLGVDAATGDKRNVNRAYIKNYWGGSPFDLHDETLLSGETAMKLIDEINSLPDVYGDENDDPAYMIDLHYYDENHIEHNSKKNGYGGFPDNWKQIIAYTNEISEGREGLTDSTDLVRVDADHLREHFGITDDMLPEGVTVEEFFEIYPVTYFDLYNSTGLTSVLITDNIRDFKYGYYNLISHRIYKDTVPATSDAQSLKEYAEENLDSITSADDICVTGTFMDHEFQIVRFDNFEKWQTDTGVDRVNVKYDDDTIDIYYDREAGYEGAFYREKHLVYVDPSNRFLIITEDQINYDVINAYFNR